LKFCFFFVSEEKAPIWFLEIVEKDDPYDHLDSDYFKGQKIKNGVRDEYVVGYNNECRDISEVCEYE
jgi:hypothetical protein